MFGYLRFILAFLVMLSHIGVKFYTLNLGVIAVVIFYILAGYVVSHLIRDIFSRHCEPFSHCEELATKQSLQSLRGACDEAIHKQSNPQAKQSTTILLSFYKDRFLRIFPTYIYVLFLTLLFLFFTSFAQPSYSLLKLINNVTVIPLNYYMYIDSTILTNPSWWLIPPAWSLGTELQAYLLLPFALMYRSFRTVLIFVSFAVYMAANLSIIHSDYFGYRFLIGVFFMFLAGSAIQSYEKQDRTYIVILWFCILFFAVLFSAKNLFDAAYTKETFIGLLLGIPLILFLSKTKIKLPFNSLFGELSYALFLTHFLAIWILKYFAIEPLITSIYIAELTSLSLFISVLVVFTVPFNRNKYLK